MSYPDRIVASPLELPGCALWLDASVTASITKDGSDNVSQWSDQSGNARHATNGTGNATRPVYFAAAVGGMPAVRFLNASDSFLDLPAGVAPSGDADHTAFVVGQRLSGAGGSGALAWLRLATTTSVRTNSVVGAHNSTGAAYFGTAGIGTPLGDVLALGTTYVLSKRYRASTKQGNNVEGWANSAGRAAETSQMTLGNTAGWLGCSVSTASANFYACEVIVFTRALTDGEIALVERYLATKWGALAGKRQIATPLEIANCGLWLDAAQGVTLDGSSKVSQWNDQSGNARHAVQASASLRPGYSAASSSFNGRPAILFDGIDDFLATAGWAMSQPYTVFIAARATSAPAGGPNLLGRISGGLQLAILNTSPPTLQMYSGSFGMPSPAVTAGRAFILGMRVESATSMARLAASETLRGDLGVQTFSSGFNIGASATPDRWWPGDVAEVIVFARKLTDGEFALVEQYLNRKYAVAPQRQIASPLEIQSCVAWLDAAQGVTLTSGAVSAWADQSGSGNHVSQGSAGARPVMGTTLSGRPCIVFDGVDDFLNKATIDLFGTGPYTIFLVVKVNASVNFQSFFGNTDTNKGVFLTQSSGRRDVSHSAVADQLGDPIQTTSFEVWTARRDAVTPTRLRVDGRQNGMSGATATMNAAGASGHIVLGAIRTGGTFSNFAACSLAEALCFNRALTDGEVVLVERYLANKYAL